MTSCATPLDTCSAMQQETDVDILLCYYNALIKKINEGTSSYTEDDTTCASLLAAQISTEIQNNLGSVDLGGMVKDRSVLLPNLKESSDMAKQQRRDAVLWLFAMAFVLYLVIFLWNSNNTV